MYEQAKYINHINEVINFGEQGVYINENELHNYAWEYTTEGNTIGSFYKKICKYSLPVVVANVGDGGVNAINSLMECSEKDILARKNGKLVIGGYYLPCYITSSKKKKYNKMRGYSKIDLTVVSDYPNWTKEYTTSYRANGETIITPDTGTGNDQVNLDYSYDFPYDFSTTASNSNLLNKGFMAADFKLILYGQVSNPSLYIAGHKYAMNCNIAKGEYLVINSRDKTITLVRENGENVNYFKYRDKSSYIFEKIPSGENAVTWARGFSFDVIIFEERSEPKWT